MIIMDLSFSSLRNVKPSDIRDILLLRISIPMSWNSEMERVIVLCIQVSRDRDMHS